MSDLKGKIVKAAKWVTSLPSPWNFLMVFLIGFFIGHFI